MKLHISKCYSWHYLLLAVLVVVSALFWQRHLLWALVLKTACSVRSGHSFCTYFTPYYYRGRTDVSDPSPRCCRAEDCLSASSQRNAVVVPLRNDDYLPMLQEVACSINATNEGLPLLVMTAAGDLSPAVEAQAASVGRVVHVPDLTLPNSMRDGRYALNWLKIRAWEWEDDWDALLLIDADTTITGDIQHLFNLPTDFATVLDMDKTVRRYTSLGSAQGGVVLLRPCRAVAEHMVALAMGDERLQFRWGHAEQDFFNWYFRYSRLTLPLMYNAIGHLLAGGRLLPDGSLPRIVHFTWHKPFRRQGNIAEHALLCRHQRLSRRQLR